MDSVDVGKAAPEFTAAAAFDGARQGYVFRSGEQGVGYYRDGHSSKRRRQQMPPPPPRPPPQRPTSQPAPRSSPSQPPPPLPTPSHLPPLATAIPTSSSTPAQSFWDELDAFGQALDASSAQGCSSVASSRPLRPQSPPAHLPLPETTEIIQWRPRRRRQQQRTVPYIWPSAMRATQVMPQAQVEALSAVPVRPRREVRARAPHPGPASELQASTSAKLMEWTEGTRPGSLEWIQALREHAQPLTGWEADWTKL